MIVMNAQVKHDQLARFIFVVLAIWAAIMWAAQPVLRGADPERIVIVFPVLWLAASVLLIVGQFSFHARAAGSALLLSLVIIEAGAQILKHDFWAAQLFILIGLILIPVVTMCEGVIASERESTASHDH
ncbi:hypothetical protein QP222_05725 [Corynebacterium pyruviciproducens]|uniref:hypothetical protein n=1 Tax=Corynebacterium pyruviciproducens TaxID=598660 RepID=UPI00254DDCD2|nr:hypothetical protein [Corynebacterium pyruviciproducens]MDK6565908.1 hypothetical protein [Corynebacterium pyruviciproducens]